MNRKLLVAAVSAVCATTALSGCYVIPIDPRYPQPSGQPPLFVGQSGAAVPIPPPQPVPTTLQARLYPLNEMAGKMGALSATVTDSINGHATFSLNHGGELLQGEASRVAPNYPGFGNVHREVYGDGRMPSGQRGIASGVLAAFFIATFVFYWWPPIRHESRFLWRVFHQIHHSPQRIEVITAFYKHPAEMVANSVIGALLVYALLGLSVQAGAVYTACTALAELLYHTNVRTAQWIGYFFKRPEMHRIHQQYRRHKNNYGDIVCWDILFGTYENPEEVDCKCGFNDPREQRLRDMLLCKDVNAPPT